MMSFNNHARWQDQQAQIYLLLLVFMANRIISNNAANNKVKRCTHSAVQVNLAPQVLKRITNDRLRKLLCVLSGSS